MLFDMVFIVQVDKCIQQYIYHLISSASFTEGFNPRRRKKWQKIENKYNLVGRFFFVILNIFTILNFRGVARQSKPKMSAVRCHHPKSLLVPNADFGGANFYIQMRK